MPLEEREKPKIRIPTPEELKESHKKFLEAREVWNLWDDPEVRKKFPEFADYFAQIMNKFDLSEYKLNEELVKSIFIEYLPPNTITKDYDSKNRAGAYVGFQKDGHILIVHAFYKSRKPGADYICWRAKAVQTVSGEIVEMPKKLFKPEQWKVPNWCQNFYEHFLPFDLARMLLDLNRPA